MGMRKCASVCVYVITYLYISIYRNAVKIGLVISNYNF